MYNLIAHVFRRILRILTYLPMTLRLTTDLTGRQSWWLMTSTYFKEMSCCTLSWWFRWPSIWVLVPLVLNMKLLVRRHMIPSAPPPECRRRRHPPKQGTSTLAMKSYKETHTTHLSLREYFVSVDVFFYFRDYSLYFILFKRLYFIFLYLWFEIEFILFMVWN
jgi:hypothetical protein